MTGSVTIIYTAMDQTLRDIEHHMQELSIAQKVGHRVWEGSVFCNLGITYYKLCDFKKAIGCYTRALGIAEEVEDRRMEGNVYGKLGNAYRRLGNFKQAIEYHKQHLSIAKELGHRAGVGNAYGNLGNAYEGLGNFKQAIEYHKQHLSIAKELGNRAGVGIAYGNLGNAYQGLGNFKRAIEYQKQRLSIAKELGDRAGVGKAYGNLGIAYHCLGNLKQAIEYHKQDLSIAKEIGDRAREGNVYGNLGSAYDCLGNFKQAIEYHKQCLSIAKEVGDRAGEGGAYGNLCIAYLGLGNFKQSIEYNNQHLSVAKELGNRAGEGNAYGNQGNAYHCLDNFKQAIEYHEQDLSIAKELGNRAAEGNAYGNLGNAYLGLGNFKQAIEYHNQRLSIVKELGDAIGEGTVCYNLGLDYEYLGYLSEAVDYYRLSIKHLDNTRGNLQSEDEWKIDFRNRYQDAYTALWRTLLKAEDTDGALCAAEQGRAQALTDVLKNQYDIEALPPASFNPEETISCFLRDSSTQTVFVALDKNTATFWVLGKDAEIHLRQKKIEHESATVLMDAVLKDIGAGVGVRCEDRSLNETTEEAPTREAVEETFRHSSSTPVNSLRTLYDAIIGPVEDLLQGDELIIVPDGPFCLAPYSALSESIRIRTVPSLTALKLITCSPENFHSKSGALLVGDPCMEEVPKELPQLPCAKEEVEMIGELLKITPLTGRDATKGEVLKKIPSVALLHIAAHGCQETGEIALAPNPDRASQIPKEEDFILTMSDVQAVRLRARLVVLSCCHSGRGEVKSEGVVGIARAFLCAGARSALVSLWAIDDEATLLFMRSFYQHLAKGERVSVALHQAMKSLRESQQFCAVKYWAPFVLIGDDVTLEFAEQS